MAEISSGSREFPPISVIVPVHNAENTIVDCVSALVGQEYAGNYEIVIVDNNSVDRSYELVSGLTGEIKLLQECKQGASAARNTGILNARYELVAFTDADCIPHSNWLAMLAMHWKEVAGVRLVGGRIQVKEPTTTVGKFAEFAFNQQEAIERYRPPCIITANALAKRCDLIAMGMFNESYLRAQDVEISYRAFYQHHASFSYCESAVVDHVNVDSLPGLWHKGWQHGRGAAKVWRDYRESLACSPTARLREIKPYLAVLWETCRLAIVPLSGEEAGTQRHYAFYRAVFEMGKQAGFSWQTLTQRLQA